MYGGYICFIEFCKSRYESVANPALLFGIGIFLGQSVGAVQFSAFNNITPPSMGERLLYSMCKID